MAWPTNTISNANLDEGTDKLSNARVQLNELVISVSDMIEAGSPEEVQKMVNPPTASTSNGYNYTVTTYDSSTSYVDGKIYSIWVTTKNNVGSITISFDGLSSAAIRRWHGGSIRTFLSEGEMQVNQIHYLRYFQGAFYLLNPYSIESVAGRLLLSVGSGSSISFNTGQGPFTPILSDVTVKDGSEFWDAVNYRIIMGPSIKYVDINVSMEIFSPLSGKTDDVLTLFVSTVTDRRYFPAATFNPTRIKCSLSVNTMHKHNYTGTTYLPFYFYKFNQTSQWASSLAGSTISATFIQ